jgi:bifunctional UDP-N-acetylglucosamine pyrophosphorylase/glucosamine-1-phosphate N-acetyltransferase
MGFAGMMALADIRRDIRGDAFFVSETSPAAVVILAAGEGRRMKSRTPKVLHTLCGRTLLGHAIAAAAELDPGRLVIVVGHGREQVSAQVAAGTPEALVVYRSSS